MIDQARSARSGDVEFRSSPTCGSWRPAEPVDVLVTNATLQWVPGHLDLLPRLGRAGAPAGGMARPAGARQPGRPAAHAAARPGRRRRAGRRWSARPRRSGRRARPRRRTPRCSPTAGCQVDAWETTYLHILDPEGRLGPDAVLAWAMGTALRPVLDLLPDNDIRDEFLDEYAALLRSAYPRRPVGHPAAVPPGLRRRSDGDVVTGDLITGLDHVQVACPPGSEDRLRAFYVERARDGRGQPSRPRWWAAAGSGSGPAGASCTAASRPTSGRRARRTRASPWRRPAGPGRAGPARAPRRPPGHLERRHPRRHAGSMSPTRSATGSSCAA